MLCAVNNTTHQQPTFEGPHMKALRHPQRFRGLGFRARPGKHLVLHHENLCNTPSSPLIPLSNYLSTNLAIHLAIQDIHRWIDM